MNDSGKYIYDAIEAHYQAEAKSAKATLSVYLNNAAGIGEHPQVVEESIKQVEKLANAKGCLEALSSMRVEKLD
jgi:hypothetical protein